MLLLLLLLLPLLLLLLPLSLSPTLALSLAVPTQPTRAPFDDSKELNFELEQDVWFACRLALSPALSLSPRDPRFLVKELDL